MAKLKKLNDNDLEIISDFIYSKSEDFILNQIKSKEISDLSINIEASYENEQLDVDISIDLSLDPLSKKDPNLINNAISYSLGELDKFLDDNYRM